MVLPMSVFTSNRERRFWCWALIVVIAIWSTLALAGTLVEQLRELGLLEVSFGFGFLLVIVAIVGNALGGRPPAGREIWVVLGIVTVCAMVVVRMGVPLAERTHLFEYGLVAVLVHRALVERRLGGRGVKAPAACAMAATALLGWIDEGIQALIPNRVYDFRDVWMNALAGVMAIAASLVLNQVRRNRDRRLDRVREVSDSTPDASDDKDSIENG